MIDHTPLSTSPIGRPPRPSTPRPSSRSAIALAFEVRASSWVLADANGMDLGVVRRDPVGGAHVAFRCAGPRFRRRVLRGCDGRGREGQRRPGLRTHYHEHYYGAFVHDADGNNIEAVCQQPQ